MGFKITCKCGATIPPERLASVRLDRIPTECDACAAKRKDANTDTEPAAKATR